MYLVGIVREIDFMKDLGRLVLDGLYLHQVRWVPPRSIAGSPEQPGGWRIFDRDKDGKLAEAKCLTFIFVCMYIVTLPQSLVKPLHAVSEERMLLPGLQETLDVRQQHVAGRKETSTQPQ